MHAATVGQSEAAGAGVWAPERRRLTAGLVATVTLFASEALAVATIMPLVADELGRSGYGLAFSAFFLGSVLGTLLGGPSSDRLGPSTPYLASVALFTLGLVIGGTAPTMVVLVVGRLAQGVGSGAVNPLVYATIGRAYPDAARPRMLAVVSTAWVVPGIVGPGLAGVVAEAAGWRWVFLGLIPLVLAAALVCLAPLRRLGRVPGAGPPAHTLRALGFAGGAALVLVGLEVRPWPLALGCGVAGVALAAVSGRSLLPPGVLRLRPGLASASVVRGLLTYAFVCADAFVPYAVTTVRGRSVLAGSVAVTLSTVTWTAGAWVSARQLPRWGAANLVRLGFVVLAGGLVLELLLVVDGVPLAVGLAGAAVAGLGIGLAYSPLSEAVLSVARAGEEGHDASALSLFDGLGFAFGPAVTGALVAAGERGGWSLGAPLALSWAIAAAVALVGAVLTVRLGPAARRRPSPS